MSRNAKADRSDPKTNKSLAIRTVLAEMPAAKAAEVAEAAQTQFGHKVTPTLCQLVKSKCQLKTSRSSKRRGTVTASTSGSAAEWVESIKLAGRLLRTTGSVESAVAILQAVEP